MNTNGIANGSSNNLNVINSNNGQSNPTNINIQNGPIGSSQPVNNSSFTSSNISNKATNQS
jgi:hypothetical protein